MIGHVLLDTDVTSYIFKGDSRADLYRQYIDEKLWAISFQSIAELEQWADLRGWGDRRKAELEAFLNPFVILNSDRELCKAWAAIRAGVRRDGRAIDPADAWIAATGVRYRLPLVTNNRTHFFGVRGLLLLPES